MKVELFSSGYATWSEKAKLFSSGYATWSGKHEQFENVYHHNQKANLTAPSSTDIILVKPDSDNVETKQFARFYHHDQKANSTALSSTDFILMKPDSFVSGYATWSGEPEL